MGPYCFFPNHLFCLSQRKTHWTMAVDRVGLKKVVDVNLRGQFAIFSSM